MALKIKFTLYLADVANLQMRGKLDMDVHVTWMDVMEVCICTKGTRLSLFQDQVGLYPGCSSSLVPLVFMERISRSWRVGGLVREPKGQLFLCLQMMWI